MKLKTISNACTVLCVLLPLGREVAHADAGLATFFQTFKKAEDLKPGSLREYLSKYPEHSLDVRAYIERVPADFITETWRKMLLTEIRPSADS